MAGAAPHDDRIGPERRPGAQPGDSALPEHSHAAPGDDPQPSSEHREHAGAPAAPSRSAGDALIRRARTEALLEGIPLPATKSDLGHHLHSAGGREAARAVKALPSRRYSTIDEVGEALVPVQPAWPRPRRVPRAESDLPPGGEHYGV